MRGYALPGAIGSQLLVRLHRRVSVPAASSGVANGGGDGHGDAPRRAATDVVVADVRRLPDELSAGDLARANFGGGEQTAAEAGELAVGSMVRVMSDRNEMIRTWNRDWQAGWTDEIADTCGVTAEIIDKSAESDVPGGVWKLPEGVTKGWKCVPL